MAAKTVTELAELFGVTRQAMNNRVRALEDEFIEKNPRGYTVVNDAGIRELEAIYGKQIDDSVSADKGERSRQPREEVKTKPFVSRSMRQPSADKTTKEAEKLSAASDQDKTIFGMLSGLMEGKDAEIERLNDQLSVKDAQILTKDQQLEMLGGQIVAKDHQIAEKDKQLDQQQQLTAAALQDREQILLELKEEKNKGFFARVFGR